MRMHHNLDCAKSSLNPESHWLVNGWFLLTESFCNYLFSVTSLWCTFVNPFLVVHPTHILVPSRVHRSHRLNSADLCDYRDPLFSSSNTMSSCVSCFAQIEMFLIQCYNSTVLLGYHHTCNEAIIYLSTLENTLQNRQSWKCNFFTV